MGTVDSFNQCFTNWAHEWKLLMNYHAFNCISWLGYKMQVFVKYFDPFDKTFLQRMCMFNQQKPFWKFEHLG
jgi:hypothetical protein